MLSTHLFFALAPILAPSHAIAPATPLAAPLRAASHADAVDARAAELLGRPAYCTAFSLDALGTPDVRIDVFPGTPRAFGEHEVVDFLRRFHFDDGASPSIKATTDERLARSIVLVGAEPAVSIADATYFDPQLDVVVTFRSLRAALACSASFPVWASSSGATGTNQYWYFSGDGVTASVGANRGSSADPDAYLAYWTGSSWSQIQTSLLINTIDSVGAHNAGCYSNDYRLRVNLYDGGAFSVRASRFTAN